MHRVRSQFPTRSSGCVGCFFLCGNVEADLVTELVSETGHGEMEKRMTTVMIVVMLVTIW